MSHRTKRRFARGVGLALVVALLASVFLAVHASPAMACQCVVRTSIHHLADADVVFTGRLTDIERSLVGPIFSTMEPITYRFEVNRVLKGAVPANAGVRSVVSGGSCGLEQMALGERYTVFAVARDGSFAAGLCGGTHVGDPNPALALVSGALLPPIPGAPPWWTLILIAIAAILATTVGRRGWSVLRSRRPAVR